VVNLEDFKHTIRFYKPNDPYYYEVDNLPLEDLLHNDRILLRALTLAQTKVGGDGDIATKQYVETTEGEFERRISDVGDVSETERTNTKIRKDTLRVSPDGTEWVASQLNVEDMEDVSISDLQDGDILGFSDSDTLTNIAPAADSLRALEDVEYVSPSPGDTLQYNANSETWQNRGCRREWIQNTANGKWYFLTEPADWDTQVERAFNADPDNPGAVTLATVRNQEENKWLRSFCGARETFIGLMKENGSWVWQSGESDTGYRDWRPGQPDNQAGEDKGTMCYLVDNIPSNGNEFGNSQWNDRAPDVALPAILESPNRLYLSAPEAGNIGDDGDMFVEDNSILQYRNGNFEAVGVGSTGLMQFAAFFHGKVDEVILDPGHYLIWGGLTGETVDNDHHHVVSFVQKSSSAIASYGSTLTRGQVNSRLRFEPFDYFKATNIQEVDETIYDENHLCAYENRILNMSDPETNFDAGDYFHQNEHGDGAQVWVQRNEQIMYKFTNPVRQQVRFVMGDNLSHAGFALRTSKFYGFMCFKIGDLYASKPALRSPTDI
jgi:hypothetical protein